jgi:hypothetical protein
VTAETVMAPVHPGEILLEEFPAAGGEPVSAGQDSGRAGQTDQ